jgi:cellobiose-specific phosphotransferase system component IIC
MIWQWDSIERKNPFTGLGEVFQMTLSKFAYILGVLLFLFFIGLALNLLFDTILIGFLWSFVSTNLHLNSANYNDAEAVFKSIFSIFTFFATYTMLLAGSGITFHSIMEIIYGEKLLERINIIQLKRNVRGMELE